MVARGAATGRDVTTYWQTSPNAGGRDMSDPSTEGKPIRKSDGKPKQKSNVAAEIKKGKAELTDDELTKVSGGVPPHKTYVDT
jgi:bacteriocin-like protein